MTRSPPLVSANTLRRGWAMWILSQCSNGGTIESQWGRQILVVDPPHLAGPALPASNPFDVLLDVHCRSNRCPSGCSVLARPRSTKDADSGRVSRLAIGHYPTPKVRDLS